MNKCETCKFFEPLDEKEYKNMSLSRSWGGCSNKIFDFNVYEIKEKEAYRLCKVRLWLCQFFAVHKDFGCVAWEEGRQETQ